MRERAARNVGRFILPAPIDERCVGMARAEGDGHDADVAETRDPSSPKRWLYRRPWLMAVLRELNAYRFHADD